MLTPPRALPPGGHIAVLAASGPSPLDRIQLAQRSLEQRGFRVTLAENIDRRHRGYLAGTDDERAEVTNRFLRDPQFDAFFFARGGYGAMRILDRLDYQAIVDHPRPVVGFSDITAIHQAMAVHAGVRGFHGPLLNLDFHDGLSPDIDRWCWAVLAGEAPLTWQLSEDNLLLDGEAEGVLFGGCLALTDSLVGTPYDFWIDDGIWFWEDVDEPVYRLDRMLTHLHLSGRMHGLRGVVIGKLRGCGDEPELLAFLREFFAPFQIPVVRNLPFGHFGDNLLMPIGTNVRLSSRERTLVLTEPAVLR
ncbi:MAG TPA: LD-carboxypeptidase [Thermoanaerobaculia bacterium]